MGYHTMSKMKIHRNYNKFPAIPFTVLEETGYFQIIHLRIAYYFPETIAAKLDQWHRDGGRGWIAVDEFYNTLSAAEKDQVARFDMNENRYL